ncbi:MAG: Error-prone repair homolog of DNA polymerase III alpha subunit, partial [uncultured Nocardioidaceae bacterium]
QGVPAHPGEPGPGGAARPAGAAGQRARQGRRRRPGRPAPAPGGAARRPAAPRRAAPVRGAAVRPHAARPHAGGVQLAGVPDEPVRQGRRRGARAAQARRARHPHAVRDGVRGAGGEAGRRRGRRRRRHRPGRPRHLRPGEVDQDPRLLPDRVAGPARAGRQVRAGDLRGPHHRHLAVPARAGQERHGAAVPRGPAGLGVARLPAPRPRRAPRADVRRRGVPRAGPADRQHDDGLHPRGGRRGAPLARRPGGPAGGAGLVRADRARPRLRHRGRRAGVGGAQGLRLVRVLQGPRRGLRPADLPVGVAQGPSSRRVPRGRAHPRPRHVPQAADPRRRPAARHRRPVARRQRLGCRLRGGEGQPARRAAAGDPRPGARPGDRGRLAPCTPRGPAAAGRARVRHPDRARRRQGHQRRRGRPCAGGPALRLPVGLLAPRLGLPPGGRAAGRRRGVRLPVRAGLDGPGAPARAGHPARPAAAGRRARPLEPVDRGRSPQGRTTPPFGGHRTRLGDHP